MLTEHSRAQSRAITPHGGHLVHRTASGDEARELAAYAATLPALHLTNRQISDLDLIANGALSPLTGFMGRADYESVVRDMHLSNGLPWTIPVTLAINPADAPRIGSGVTLKDAHGTPRAVLTVSEVFTYDKQREAEDVYRTTDGNHPGVAALYGQGDVLVAGPIDVLPNPSPRDPYALTPAETRGAFAEREWRTIVGFQTRNPIHRAHEYIQKCALEIVDGLLVHPLVGETKADDIPAAVRMRCYEVLLAGYYPSDRTMLSVLPAAMRYAGPREALFHAIIRKNYGCTHFIVGRDHAGVGSYYGTYDAQHLFNAFNPDALGIIPLKFDNSFFCRKCEGMASEKSCPHGPNDRVNLSGTKVRAMLRAGEIPPMEFTRPEVARVLMASTWAQQS